MAPAPDAGRDGASADDDPDRAHVTAFTPTRRACTPRPPRASCARRPSAARLVLDPFCGSGTVLVEAMIAGRRAVGTDLNPLAVRLARLKTARLDAGRARRARRAARAPSPRSPTSDARGAPAPRGAIRREDVALFDPHVLLELDSIRAAIGGLDAPPAACATRWRSSSARSS